MVKARIWAGMGLCNSLNMEAKPPMLVGEYSIAGETTEALVSKIDQLAHFAIAEMVQSSRFTDISTRNL